MALPKFDYYAPESLKEANELALSHAGKYVLMAGGTDVILLLKDRRVLQCVVYRTLRV